MEVSGLLGFD